MSSTSRFIPLFIVPVTHVVGPVVGPVVDPGFNPQARDYKLFIISCLQAITTTIVVMLRSSNDLVLEFSQSSGFGSRLRSLTG